MAASGAGVRHHVNGVKGLLLNRFPFGINHLLNTEFIHHLARDLVAGMSPDVHHFIVAFAISQQALAMLLLNGFDLDFRDIQSCCLAVGDHHVVDPNRYARLGRHGKPGVHQLVAEDHRILKTYPAVSLIDRRRDCPLFHRLVDEIKRQAVREDLRQQCPARGSLNQVECLLTLAFFVELNFTNPYFDSGVEGQRTGIARTTHF